MLASWLQDADGDGAVREEDGLSRRVIVWAGPEQDHPALAAAVLNHWGPELLGDALSWRGDSS